MPFRRISALVAVLVVASSAALAQQQYEPGGKAKVASSPGTVSAIAGTQQITLSGSAQTLTVPAGAKTADLMPEGSGGTNNNCLRYRDDGTNPTASVGIPLEPGQGMFGYAGPLSVVSFINATGATCTLNVAYYK